MLSFEDREFVEKEDKDIIKAVGKKYSGPSSWPLFRSYRPGMVPWFMDETEQKSMVNYLEQFLEIALNNKRTLEASFRKQDSGRYLVRECRQKGGTMLWEDTFQQIPVTRLNEIKFTVDLKFLEKARRIPAGNNIFEVDFFFTPAQVKEKNNRPYFSYMFLMIDQKSELIIAHEMLNPTEGFEKMLARIPTVFISALSKLQALPSEVQVESNRLYDLLTPLMKSLPIKLLQKPRLKSLEMAKEGIMRYFGNG